MTLISALGSALTGMQASQRAADLVSRNVANATTDGYTKKVLPRDSLVLAGQGAGVVTGEVQRQLDLRVQAQMWVEQSSSARLDVVDDFLQRVDRLFGKPDQDLSLASSVQRLSTAFQELADDPQNVTARQSVIGAADALARDLNRMSGEVQEMRREAEQGLAQSVATANDALQSIHRLNQEISKRIAAGDTVADLEDQRDAQIARLSEQMDIRQFRRAGNQIAIFTPAGQPLLDATPRVLQFDERSNIGPGSLYDGDPRGVGTVTLSGPEGRIDLLADGGLETGKIAGYAQVRDVELVRAQDQLDELAHALAIALSERVGTVSPTVDAAATVNGANPVVAVDLAGLETAGDTVTVTLNPSGPITLTAIDPADAPPAAGQFVADPDPAVRLENLRTALQTALDGAAGAGEFTVSVVEGASAGGGAGPMLTIADANLGANDDITALTAQYVARDGDALPASLSATQAQLDLSGITKPGDTVMMRYRDTSGQVRTVELTAIADPEGRPVPPNSFVLGATPEDTAAAIRTQLAAAISTFESGAVSLSVDMPGVPGTTLTVQDGAPGANAEILSLHATSRSAGTIGGEESQFAVFADGPASAQKAYTGFEPVTTADGDPQKLGFAARIQVSKALREDDTLLVQYPTPPNASPTGSAAIGNPTRPLELLARLTQTPRSFDPDTGIGSEGAPYVGSVQSFAVSMVSYQAVNAAEASDRKAYQDAVRQNVELRFDQSAGVNVDKEMADLLMVENLYASSAQVLTTVQRMLDDLMQILR